MMGEKDLTAEDLPSYLEETVVFEELGFSKLVTKLIHIEEVNGVMVYKMEITNTDGTSFVNYYDVKTALKVGSMQIEDSPEGAMISTSTFKDYKDVNGILFPYVTVQDNAGQVMELKVESVVLGGKVSDSLFKQ